MSVSYVNQYQYVQDPANPGKMLLQQVMVAVQNDPGAEAQGVKEADAKLQADLRLGRARQAREAARTQAAFTAQTQQLYKNLAGALAAYGPVASPAETARLKMPAGTTGLTLNAEV